MNKTELIDAIAASADIPKAAAGRALDAVVDSITGARRPCVSEEYDASDGCLLLESQFPER